MTTPNMSRQHYEFIADVMGPLVGWPSHLHAIADALEKTNPKFNRDRFINRATKKWEENHAPFEVDDSLPYM